MYSQDKNYSPYPLADLNFFFEGLFGTSVKTCHWNVDYFVFEMVSNINLRHCAGESKLDAQLNPQSQVKKAGFHGAPCQLASSKCQTI